MDHPSTTPDVADILAQVRDLDANGIVRAFAADPAFRAAEWHELTTENNPYRRPVRPDDLDWLDFSVPMAADDALRLSALLGHRMLRNVHDAELVHLPDRPDEANRADAATFHGPRNRILSALARPVLEGHLFAPLADVVGEPPRTPDALRATVLETAEQRRSAPGEALRVAGEARHRTEAVSFLVLQLAAFRPAGRTALGRAALASGAGEPTRRRLAALRDELTDDPATRWLAAAGLVESAAAYWQLSLGTSLGRGNHLLGLAASPERFARLLGALVHEELDRRVTRRPVDELVADAFGATAEPQPVPGDLDDLGDVVDDLVRPLHERFGHEILDGVHRGFTESAWLAGLWDRDLADQLDWADRIDEYQEAAERIDKYLSNEGIEVDLDTFVESSEETSTTHVHDDHRLVMIESGRMHFWNNTTHKIELVEGDKLLIPQTRLHGSTVLSGSCTYHQPIIPDELLRQFR